MYALLGLLAAGDNGGAIPLWFMIVQISVAASGGLVAIIVALIAAKSAAKNAVQRSLERFRREQCWQAKREAYASILASLNDLGQLFAAHAIKIRAVASEYDPTTDIGCVVDLTEATARLHAVNAVFAVQGFFLSAAAKSACQDLYSDLGPLSPPRDVKAVDGDDLVRRLAEPMEATDRRIRQAIVDFHAIAEKDLDITWADHSSRSLHRRDDGR